MRLHSLPEEPVGRAVRVGPASAMRRGSLAIGDRPDDQSLVKPPLVGVGATAAGGDEDVTRGVGHRGLHGADDGGNSVLTLDDRPAECDLQAGVALLNGRGDVLPGRLRWCCHHADAGRTRQSGRCRASSVRGRRQDRIEAAPEYTSVGRQLVLDPGRNFVILPSVDEPGVKPVLRPGR